MTRLEALALTVLVGAACSRGAAPVTAATSATSCVDDSFARYLLAHPDADESSVELRDHPAVAAVLRHRQMTGDAAATPATTLALMLGKARASPPSQAVLDAWAGHERELVAAAEAASDFLPGGRRFTGTVRLLAGYDIGVPAPPDITLNVGHPHFAAAPAELAFYATHEAHHVGFMAVRPVPSLDHLTSRDHLLEVVAYLTQLEGMAVHSAFPARQQASALTADGDYLVYIDPAEARRVTLRYGALLAPLPAQLTDDVVGNLLDTLTTNERLVYRFGALVAREVERGHGRAALIATIAEPAPFFATAAELLRAAGATAPPAR